SAAGAIGESTGGAMVVCKEPARGRDEGYAAITVTPSESGLEINGYSSETAADYVRHGVALLQRDFRTGPHESLGVSNSLRLACRGAQQMWLLIDGEPREAGIEEAFALSRCEVDLLV